MAKGRRSPPLPDTVDLLPPARGLSGWMRDLLRARELTVEQARGLVLRELADWVEASAAGIEALPEGMTVQLTTRSVALWTGAPEPSVRRALGEAANEGLIERVDPGVYEAFIALVWPDDDDGWERRDDGAVVYWR